MDRRPPKNVVFLLQESAAFAQLSHLGLIGEGQALANTFFDVGLAHPSMETTFGDAEVLGNLTMRASRLRATAATSRWNFSGYFFAMLASFQRAISRNVS